MNNHQKLGCVVLVVLVAASGAFAGGEWTRFRGPDGAGISPPANLPVKWTDKDYNWKVELPGTGYSSPVLWGDRIFLTCANEKTAKRTVCGLRAGDGKLLWRRDYESKPYRHHRNNSFASSSAAVDADRVYLSWTTPNEVTLLALDHDGKDVWRRNLGAFKAMHGSGTSPIVMGDVVVLANDQAGGSFLIGVDCKTGKTRWKLDRRTGRASYITPCVYRPDGGPAELIFASSAHGITSIDPGTGKVNWEVAGVFPSSQRCVGSPVVASGLIVATCGTGGSGKAGVAVRPGSAGGKTPAKVAWRLSRPIPYTVTALAKGDLLFLLTDHGDVICLRGATGKRLWQERVADGGFFGSPICVGNRLYVISKEGRVVVLAAADKYRLLGKTSLGERSYSTPAVAGGVMYLRTWTHLMSLGAKKAP